MRSVYCGAGGTSVCVHFTPTRFQRYSWCQACSSLSSRLVGPSRALTNRKRQRSILLFHLAIQRRLQSILPQRLRKRLRRCIRRRLMQSPRQQRLRQSPRQQRLRQSPRQQRLRQRLGLRYKRGKATRIMEPGTNILVRLERRPRLSRLPDPKPPSRNKCFQRGSNRMRRPEDKEHRSLIEIVKVWVEIIQGITTVVAIVAGGYWFFLQRSTKPQLKLDQTVTQRAVEGEPQKTLISVDVRATNIGKVKVDLDPGELDLTQVNPEPAAPGGALASYKLKRLTLEPGESDQAAFVAVDVWDTIKTIQVHSDYKVPNEKSLYWNLLSFADIGVNANQKESASSVR